MTVAATAVESGQSAFSEPARTSSIERVLRSKPAVATIVLVGLSLRAWAFAASSSLGLDEILLSRNILGLPLRQLLTEPLRLDQVAPRGFLLLEKLAVFVLGPGELSLRLISFGAGIVGLLLFRRLALGSLEGLAGPFALALFAVGVPFLRFGAEVKQYEMDATAAVLLLLFALDLRARDTSVRQRLAIGISGLVIVWFSQPSVVMMAGIGLAFALAWLVARDRRAKGALLVTLPLWTAACALATAAGFRSMTPSTKAFMNAFWGRGFMPMHPVAALQWFPRQALSIFADPALLRYPLPGLFLAACVVGFVALWRERREVAGILLGPVLTALIAAITHQYPFDGRLLIYLLPVILLALAAGAQWIARAATRLHPAAGASVWIALLLPPLSAVLQTPPPYVVEHTQAVLSYLQQHRQTGDAIHVFPLQRIGLLFYGPRYQLSPADWTTASCDANDTRTYLRDLERYRGTRRLWVYSAAARPFRTASAAVQDYLGTIGTRRDSLELPSLIFGSSRLELYDLSDPARLAATSADAFGVQPMPTDPRPGCRPWTSPSALDSFP